MSRDSTFNDLTRADAIEAASEELALDEDSFRGFYDRNARGVWAYLVRITGDRQQVDDLMQETFYRFLRAGAAHESEAHRRNSLYRIATNVARDAHRRSVIRRTFYASHGDPSHCSGSTTSSDCERTTDLTRALARLKPRERAMLWLAYAEGASHAEIAGVMGVQTGSMKALLFRARRRLAGLLGHADEGGER
jgi:RNA polymerase sigma-70 factor (ECF subfamily)